MNQDREDGATPKKGQYLRWSPGLLKLYLELFCLGRRLRPDFRALEAFCCFIGYPRSGHSLVGALIDAHPGAIVSHELNALQYFQAGFRRNQVFALILRKSAQFARSGHTRGGYTYLVPNQWQGRYSRLKVIGDKQGAGLAERRWLEPELLARLRRTVALPVRFIHVTRNPYDNITTLHRKARRLDQDLSASIRRYFRRCASVQKIKQQLGPDELIELRHEALIARPHETLAELCAFLGLAPDPAYLEDCAGIVYPSPHRSRHDLPWTDTQIDQVDRHIQEFPFLAGYSFED